MPGPLERRARAGWQPASAFERQQGCFKAVRAGSPHRHLSARAASKPAPAFQGQVSFKAVHLSARAASKPFELAPRTSSYTGGQPAPTFECQRAGNPHRPLSARADSKVRVGNPRPLSAKCGPGLLQSRTAWQPAQAFERHAARTR